MFSSASLFLPALPAPWPPLAFALTDSSVSKLKSKASRTVGSARARGRRERSKEKKSDVRAGKVRTEGPEAWMRIERVRRNKGRRGGVDRGPVVVVVEVVPLNKLIIFISFLVKMFDRRVGRKEKGKRGRSRREQRDGDY